MFDQEWSRAVDEALHTRPNWRGFRGILHMTDEWSTPEDIPAFTPAEFDEFWESLSRSEKIEYIKSLIT
jgi:hypothetical protein